MTAPARYDRIAPDDEVFRVRRVWIGVGDWTWPVEARYGAWGLWLGLTALLVLGGSAAFGLTWWVLMYGPTIALLATWGLFTVVDYERPITAVLTHLCRAATTRLTHRPQPAATTTTLTTRAWARQTRPPHRRWRDRLPQHQPRPGPRRRAATRPGTAGRRRRITTQHAATAAAATTRGLQLAATITREVAYAMFVAQPLLGIAFALAVALFLLDPWSHHG